MVGPRWAVDISGSSPGDPGAIVRVAGELDVQGVRLFREHVERAMHSGHGSLVVDLSEVTFVDSLGLAALVGAAQKLPPNGRLAVVAHGPYFDLLLRATGLRDILDVFEDRAAAERFAFG